jgi:hypothetical protein
MSLSAMKRVTTLMIDNFTDVIGSLLFYKYQMMLRSNVVPVHSVKAYSGIRGNLHEFLTSEIDGGDQ